MIFLLERAPINRDKDTFFDEVIAEFYSLNGKRNRYLHGSWWTNKHIGEAFIQEETLDNFSFLQIRPVDKKELKIVIMEMNGLFAKLLDHKIKTMREYVERLPLPDNTPQQHVAKSKAPRARRKSRQSPSPPPQSSEA